VGYAFHNRLLVFLHAYKNNSVCAERYQDHLGMKDIRSSKRSHTGSQAQQVLDGNL
jgi:hypothetical protein